MITQIALYKALIRFLDDKKINVEDGLNDYLTSVRELLDKIEHGKKIADGLHEIKDFMDAVDEKLKVLSNTAEPFIATEVYERCRRLKSDVDLFEEELLGRLGQVNLDHIQGISHGLRSRNQERLNVFLVGEYSAGKTTFARRLISDLVGAISGGPETACLVRHTQSKIQTLKVAFKENFSFPDAEKAKEFDAFLNAYDLRKHFEPARDMLDIWIPIDKEKVFDDWSGDKILDFLKNAKPFPEAFSQIVWNHTKSSKKKNKQTFLDFVDLFDMPGIGGDDRHDPVIKGIFQAHKPDVILYLLDTAMGNPSDDGRNALQKLLPLIIQSDPQPLFYWVYQKPSGSYAPLDSENINSEDNDLTSDKFIKEKKEVLDEFVNDLVTGTKDVNDNEKVAPELKDYLKKTFILDARGDAHGPEGDTERAQDAVSLVLGKYFSTRGASYLKEARNMLDSKLPKVVFEVMTNTNGGYEFISKEIIEKIETSSDLSENSARKIFWDAFHMGADHTYFKDKRPNLYVTLDKWLVEINSLIDEMINSFTTGLFERKISLDKLKEYEAKYKDNPNWQTLLYKVQAYHWIMASYRGEIAPQYFNRVGAAILDKIAEDIQKIDNIKVLLHIEERLEE